MARTSAPQPAGPPKRVQVGPIAYTLRQDDLITDVGQTHPDRQLILLRTNQAPDYLADTVLHEVLHACLAHTPLELSEETEEHVCLVLAPALLDVMRRNPELVAFLLGRG